MRRGIAISAALHAGIIGASLIAWPHALDLPAEEETPVVPVDVVTIAETTNVAPTVTEQQPAPPPEEPTPPAPKEEPAPPPPEAAPSPEPKPVEQAEEKPKPPRAPAIPRPRPEPEKPQNFDVDSVLALLDKRAPKAAPPANAPAAEQTVKGIGAQNALTVDIKDALLAQIRECWNVPVGAPHPEQLIVQVRVFLAPDGHLAQPPQLTPDSRAAAASSTYMRAAADAALRAISVCEPYHGLPAEKYDAWREIVMTFDPSKMVR